jgi:hypothetical protein
MNGLDYKLPHLQIILIREQPRYYSSDLLMRSLPETLLVNYDVSFQTKKFVGVHIFIYLIERMCPVQKKQMIAMTIRR